MKADKLDAYCIIKELQEIGIILWAENGQIRYKSPCGSITQEHINNIREHKEEILYLLEHDHESIDIFHDEENRYASFPVTDIQSAYLLGREDLFEYGGVACHVYLELLYDTLDIEKTEIAFNKVIKSHDMLRVVFNAAGEQQVQKTVPYYQIKSCIIQNDNETEEVLNNIRNQMGQKNYDATKWPLFELRITKTNQNTVLHFSIDFLIADWASVWKILHKFESFYYDPCTEERETEIQFRDYLIVEQKLKNTMKYYEDKLYWKKRIPGFPSAPELPVVLENKNSRVEFSRYKLKLNVDEWNNLKKVAQKYGLTPTVVVLAAYAFVIERWSRNKRFCINLTLLKRLPLHKDVDLLVGDFTSTNILEIDFSQKNDFLNSGKCIQKKLLSDLDHQYFSGMEVMREIAKSHGKEKSFMPIVYTSAIGLVNQELKGEISPFGISQTPQVFIDCQAMDIENGLQVNWDVRKGIFPANMIEDMFSSFEDLLHYLAKTQSDWTLIKSISLPDWQLTERQIANNTKTQLEEKCLQEDFLHMVKQMPSKTAVIDANSSLTYIEIYRRALGVASELLNQGFKPQDKVGILMRKSVFQAVAVFGVLLAGGVYVPLDVDQPVKRCQKMLKQANIGFVLTNSNDGIDINCYEVRNINIDKLQEKREGAITCKVSPEQPAYIIYTSGTTGQPKGVVISHRAALNTITDINKRFNLCDKDVVLGISQLNFDLSVYDMLGILSVGGTLVYPSIERQKDPSHWKEMIREYNVTVWNSVPALLQMLVTYLSTENDREDLSLRLILLSGDWIPLNLPEKIIYYAPSAQVVGLGGATEASIWSNYHIYRGLNPEWKSIPYGRPLNNQGFRILDNKMQDCPVWVAGELYITGLGLSDGYINDEEATKAHFFCHPVDHQKLYKTGDMARYMPGGEVEFLGRRDNQVKINGHRIELGEIEAVLQKSENVEVAVATVSQINNEKGILAFVTAKKQEIYDNALNVDLHKTIISGCSELTASLTRKDMENAMQAIEEAARWSMLYGLQHLQLCGEDRRFTIDQVNQCDGIAVSFHWIVKRWIQRLVQEKILQYDNEGNYYSQKNISRNELLDKWDYAISLWNDDLGSSGFIKYAKENALLLPQLLAGKLDPVELLYPEGSMEYVESLYYDHVISKYLNKCICNLVHYIANNKNRKIRILEIGGGTGATTEQLLKTLKGYSIEYHFTDVAKFFLPSAKRRFRNYENVKFGIFNIDQDYRSQGLFPNSYDIVLAVGVLENAKNIPETMERISELICPKGWLIFTETKEQDWILMSQAFMMTEPDDNLRINTTFLSQQDWVTYLNENSNSSEVITLPVKKDKMYPLGVYLFAQQMKQSSANITVDGLNSLLEEQLPTYMFPKQVQIVDKFPVNINGKIDRKALESLYIRKNNQQWEKEADEVQANSELEILLQTIWSNALSIERISNTQNFYELGADSLIMSQVTSEIRKKLKSSNAGKNIPYQSLLRQMLNYPTILELQKFISTYEGEQVMERKETTHESNATLIEYGGGDTGILRVVFHAALGTMNCFQLLLSHLIPQNLGNIIGIAVKDQNKYHELLPEKVVETVAEDYAYRLLDLGYKRMQLIGYCLGGIVSVEAARILKEHGIEIVDHVLIDSHPLLFEIDDDLVLEMLFVPNLDINLTDAFGSIAEVDVVKGLMNILETNNNTVPRDSCLLIGGNTELDKVGNFFRYLNKMRFEERAKLYAKAMEKKSGEKVDSEMLSGMFQIYCQSFKAFFVKPQPFEGDVRFLLAKESSGMLPGMQKMTLDFWSKVFTKKYEVIEITGNHYTCVEKEPHSSKLARLLALPLMEDKDIEVI